MRENRERLEMKCVSILDLLCLTTLIAFHFAVALMSARPHGRDWSVLLILTPTVLTVVLHIRCRLSLRLATAVHFFVSLCWASIYGWCFWVASAAYDSETASHERASFGVPSMAIVAVLTSIAYFGIGDIIRDTLRDGD